MQIISDNLLFLILGIAAGSLISRIIVKQRASAFTKSTDRQLNQFEKEAAIRNLQVKIVEQSENSERMNERLKSEFKS
jgi:hypothetical protein